MAVKARATITISWINDIKSVTKYYLLQSSTANAPSKPTTNPPGGKWSKVEPAFQNGSTNTLYSVELTVFSDNSFDYSDVSKSTSYEAAKEAWNKANNAQNTANSANTKITNLNIGGRNLIRHGQGNKQKGFFKSFSVNSDGYLEASMTSKNTYATIRLDDAFVIKPRDYPVGETYIWSYDIMYTKWDFPEGSTCKSLWMGQRYTNAPSGQSSTGQWARITAHELPKVGSNGCELNKWYHVEQLITIPVQASNNVGTGSQFEFYNPSTTVAASISMRFKNVKMEHGNIATDWTPAPEDSDDDMNELVTKLDVMKIGGENLFPNSKELPTDIYSIGGGSIDSNTYKGFKVSTGICNKDKQFTDILQYIGKITPKPNTYYTLSFYAKASKNGFKMRSHFYPDCTVGVPAPDGTSSNTFSSAGDGAANNVLTTEWKRYWVRWKTTSSVSGVKNVLICRLQADISHSTNDGTQVWICGPRLEENTFNTNWAPNLTDIESEVTEQGAVMHVMKDSIESKADKTEVTKLGDDVTKLTTYTNSQFKQMSDSLTSTVSSVNQIKSNYKLGVYHTARGDSTKKGCIAFARITIKYAYCGTPISFGIVSTTKQYYNINVRFRHANTTDPDIDYISCDGNVDVYAHKVGTSTWDILCSKDNGGQSDVVVVSDYIFNSNNTELLTDAAQTKSIGVKWIDQHYDLPTELQVDKKEYIKAERLAGKMTKETITSEVKQTAEGLTVKLNKSYHDTSNYSQLNETTASYFNFVKDSSFDNLVGDDSKTPLAISNANGMWFTPIAGKMARDMPISDFYECNGGEKFKIECEMASSIKAKINTSDTDVNYTGSTIYIFGYDANGKVRNYISSGKYCSSSAEGNPEDIKAIKTTTLEFVLTIPKYNNGYRITKFRVFVQTNGFIDKNATGVLRVRNITVSKVNAVMDVANDAAKTATNYLGFSDKGLTVGNLTSSTLGNNVNINSESVDIKDGSNILASYGSDIKMYTNGKEALNINSESVDIKDGSNILASYGSDIKMYNDGKEALNINKNELIAKALDSNDKTVKSIVYSYTDTDEGASSGSTLTSFPTKWTITKRSIDMLDNSYLLLILQCRVNGKMETKYLLLYFEVKTLIINLVWDETSKNITVTSGSGLSANRYKTVQRYTEITDSSGDNYNIPTVILDFNTAIEENINGSIKIHNASTINKDMELAPLRIGDMESNDLFLSYNTIFSKSHNTQNVLYIQPDGSPVVFNNESAGLMIRDGGIYTSVEGGNDYIEVLLSELYGDHLYIGRGGFSKVDISARNQLNIDAYTLNIGSTELIINGSSASIPTVKDYAWHTSKWNAGFSNYNDSSRNAPSYRKYGQVVDFVGVATVTNSNVLINGGNGIAFNLPSGFRPSHDRYFVCQGSDKCIFSLWIRKNGEMEIGRYRDTGSSSWPAVKPGVYLAISATFTI